MNGFEEVDVLSSGTLRKLGQVQSVWLIEPAGDCADGASGGYASAVVWSCVDGVLVSCSHWLNETTGGPAIRWTVLDHNTWQLQLAFWRNRLLQIGITQPCQRMLIVPTALTGLVCADDVWEVHSANSSPVLYLRSTTSAGLAWSWDKTAASPPAITPDWLNPDACIRVAHHEGMFLRATFSGWPLSWRRAFANAAGLSSKHPVNSAAALPEHSLNRPLMQDWVCQAMGHRVATLPWLKRRVSQMSPPVNLPGISPQLLANWWKHWQHGSTPHHH